MKNIAIFAHVDAGKTTITENLLYITHTKADLGSVENGTTTTDSLSTEQRHGITIKSGITSLFVNNQKINIIDTPGHVEFINEVKTCLEIIDCAILVISAIEGLQAQTEYIYKYLKKYNIPFVVFINKIDRTGVDINQLLNTYRRTLNNNAFLLKNNNNGFIEDSLLKHFNIKTDNSTIPSISEKQIFQKIQDNLKNGCDYIIAGSAKKRINLEILLHFINHVFSSTSDCITDIEISAYIFKIDYINKKRFLFIKVLAGTLKKNQTYKCNSTKIKCRELYTPYNGSIQLVAEVGKGDIALIPCNLDITAESFIGRKSPLLKIDVVPPLYKAIISSEETSKSNFSKCIKKVITDEPSLKIYQDKNVFYIHLYSLFHGQIIEELFLEKYKHKIACNNIKPILKIIPTQNKKLIVSSKNSPEYSGLGLEISINQQNNKNIFSSLISKGELKIGYQSSIKEGVLEFFKKGISGNEIIGCEVKMFYFDFDSVHSSPSEYKRLTHFILKQIFSNFTFQVAEPYLEVNIHIPIQDIDIFMRYFYQFRLEISNIVHKENTAYIYGIMPLSMLHAFKVKYDSLIKGRLRMTHSISEYKKIDSYFKSEVL